MNVRNKLQCLSNAGLSSLVKCLRVRLGAYPSEDHLKGVDKAGKTCQGQTLQLSWNNNKLGP
jgi:hypothetical protein